ncbi:MAG: hypothetical protein RMI01_09920 [Thermodesulfovibrio sp.]|nr:hypothetical protein [Thermodesulfovibrio sp.]
MRVDHGKNRRSWIKFGPMQNITTPEGRHGGQLAIALLRDVANGTHPVEALLKANLDIRPR